MCVILLHGQLTQVGEKMLQSYASLKPLRL